MKKSSLLATLDLIPFAPFHWQLVEVGHMPSFQEWFFRITVKVRMANLRFFKNKTFFQKQNSYVFCLCSEIKRIFFFRIFLVSVQVWNFSLCFFFDLRIFLINLCSSLFLKILQRLCLSLFSPEKFIRPLFVPLHSKSVGSFSL